MSKLPEPGHTIQSMIDQYHESKPDEPRPHMGCSALGHACDRWLWLSFRWAVKPTFPGRVLRLFRRGQNEEATIGSDLRAIGMDVRNTSTHQSRVDLGCHVSGSLDGVIESGVPEAPKKRHVVEFKTHNKKSFDALEKAGAVASAKPEHFVQMQLYMHGMKIDRALYVAVCKDDDRMYTERLRYEADVAEKYIRRGHYLATSDRMPPPISTDPSWYQCKFCDAHEFCHTTRLTKEVNCRTCANSTAKHDGTWHCAKWDDTIPVDAQRKGCDGHVLHPDLVPWQRKDGPDEYTAVYQIDEVTVANGDPEQEGVFASTELLANAAACGAKGWAQLHDMRKQFDGRVVG
jgi:hypothetical protein